MKQSNRRHPAVFAWGLLAAVLAIPAALLSAYAIAKARMPYNEEGNHFDGWVVHHAGNEYVYACLALVFWALAILAGVGAYRRWKRSSGRPE